VDGYYEFSNLSSGNYTVTPSKTSYTFTPASRGYNPLNSNQDNQNFTGTYNSPTVIGSITVYNASGGFLGTYTTIQTGINACPVGGTVSVAAGNYTEAVHINKRIALIGAGSNSTTITAQGLSATNTVTFDGDSTNNALISGFRITGAIGDWPNGSGIYCGTSSPTITNNIISENGYGIYCFSSFPTIISNTISRNSSNGIYSISLPQPLLTTPYQGIVAWASFAPSPPSLPSLITPYQRMGLASTATSPLPSLLTTPYQGIVDRASTAVPPPPSSPTTLYQGIVNMASTASPLPPSSPTTLLPKMAQQTQVITVFIMILVLQLLTTTMSGRMVKVVTTIITTALLDYMIYPLLHNSSERRTITCNQHHLA
ncbi:MAG: hypothetical protein KKD66_27035, partial [Proteobacteria bacterium]|nr:hypothetical protein [Pseudomonadota bacterium]